MTDNTQHSQPLTVPVVPPAPVHDQNLNVPAKSFVATWLFAWLLGLLGIDRFYLGKIGTGVLKLVTLGGFGIWWLVDLILVLSGAQRDKQGHKLVGYEKHRKLAWIVTAAGIVLTLVFNIVTNSASPSDPPTALSTVETDNAPATAGEVPVEEVPAAEVPAAEEPAVKEPAESDAATVQSWADDTFGTFAPITQTGTGDNLVPLPAGATAGIVTSSHDGASNFAISVLDASNASTGQLLVNTIGAYNGTTQYGFNSFGDGVTLQISADGNWSLTIAPISAAPALAASGAGDGVFLYNGDAGALSATHDGARNFVVYEETGEAFNMGLLVNEIGAYSGTVPLSAGPSVIAVTADGAWTLVAG